MDKEHLFDLNILANNYILTNKNLRIENSKEIFTSTERQSENNEL